MPHIGLIVEIKKYTLWDSFESLIILNLNCVWPFASECLGSIFFKVENNHYFELGYCIGDYSFPYLQGFFIYSHAFFSLLPKYRKLYGWGGIHYSC